MNILPRTRFNVVSFFTFSYFLKWFHLRVIMCINGGFNDMTKDLTQGKIMPLLFSFTVPLVLGNLFQMTYNAVDSIIVGQFVGKEALAAVGICNPISTLM